MKINITTLKSPDDFFTSPQPSSIIEEAKQKMDDMIEMCNEMGEVKMIDIEEPILIRNFHK